MEYEHSLQDSVVFHWQAQEDQDHSSPNGDRVEFKRRIARNLWKRKILTLLLMMTAGYAQALTLSDMRTDCRVMVRDTGSNRQRFSDAQLLRFLNEGQKNTNQHIWPIRKSYEFALTNGTTYYELPSDYLHTLRVTRDHLIVPEKSVKALDNKTEWEDVEGLPINYFLRFSSRTATSSKIGFYPFPVTGSTGTARVDYIAQVTDMSADSDTPFNGIGELQPYGFQVSLYCAYRASMVDGQFQIAQAYFAEYQSWLKRMGEDAVARPNYNPSAFGGGFGTGNGFSKPGR